MAICRLFALHAGTDDVEATFWLLDAPASLAEQSHANPDGFGLATLSSAAEFELVKRPALAAEDDAFAHQARSVRAAQFLAHVRYADTGRVSLANTHPFIADGRVFAHNGVLGDLDEIDRQLGQDRDLVAGQTDSERLFALLTVAIRQAEGDVRRGIIDAVSGVAARYELYAINFLLGTAGELWAFRYPEHNQLFFLERGPGGPQGAHPLDETSGFGTIRMRSAAGAERPLVVVASEPMDEDPGWTELGVGELLHVGRDLHIDRERIVDTPPVRRMVLTGRAVESQAQEHV